MITVGKLVESMQQIAPLQYASDWDNVGLLIGAPDWPADLTLLTIDLTERVVTEARESGAGAIIAYHPPIFSPLKAITDASLKQRIVLELARHGIAVYCPHTALDAAPDGVNDWLAEACGKGDVRALRSYASLPQSEECKIVTFCPHDAVDAIRNGLATAGAGTIGAYSACSFEMPGTGTFLAGEGADPTVGQVGRFERTEEVRLEMVCSKSALGIAIIALRQFHPYEEPPMEIYELQARPMRQVGEGRRVTLDRPVALKTLLQRCKAQLGVRQLRVAHSPEAPSSFRTIGLCAGAGGSLLDDAIEQGCELFITGEMRHHDVLAALERGCSIMLAGHTNTERGYLKQLMARLSDAMPEAQFFISQADGDPLKSM